MYLTFICLTQLRRITIADTANRNRSVRATKFVLLDETSNPQGILVREHLHWALPWLSGLFRGRFADAEQNAAGVSN